MKQITSIQGGVAKDIRGQIRFVNEFDMTQVKRFYIINNINTELIRGWRAHRIEQRWFYVLSGGFTVNIIKIDDWENPDQYLSIRQENLLANEMKVLHIPAGYGTAFKALEPESEILVYSDYPVSHSSKDDYTWKLDYFKNLR